MTNDKIVHAKFLNSRELLYIEWWLTAKELSKKLRYYKVPVSDFKNNKLWHKVYSHVL